jgi:hypothetical protein
LGSGVAGGTCRVGCQVMAQLGHSYKGNKS